MDTVWILSDGLPGHYNQSIGLSNAINTAISHEAIIIDLKLKHKALRFLMRFIANHIPGLISLKTFSFFYQHVELPKDKPRFIISAGGNTLFANIALGRVLQIKNIYSGTLKGYQNHLLSLVITVVPLQGVANNAVLDLPPANIPASPKQKSLPFYTLLIGGDGAGYEYTREEWQQLSRAISLIARRDGIRWKVTTSRRTGKDAENELMQLIDDAVISESIWFSSNPQKVVRRFLHEGQLIFCTEDSLTMVSEAIYAHKPVVTLQPLIMHPEDNDALALSKYEDKGFIVRTAIAHLADFRYKKDDFCSAYPDIAAQIVKAVSAL